MQQETKLTDTIPPPLVVAPVTGLLLTPHACEQSLLVKGTALTVTFRQSFMLLFVT